MSSVPYLSDKQRHLTEVVKPLQERAEPVYAVPGSDAEAVARRKFRNKTVPEAKVFLAGLARMPMPKFTAGQLKADDTPAVQVSKAICQ
jgi:hypothetical protein